jgi:hypothetical protein
MTRPSRTPKVSSVWWCATCRLQVVVPGAPTRALWVLSPVDDVAPAHRPTAAALRPPSPPLVSPGRQGPSRVNVAQS